MSINLQPITDLDWEGLAGAESWPDGSRPLIGNGTFDDGNEWMLVFDPNGANFITIDIGTNEMEAFRFERPFQNHDDARRWVVETMAIPSCPNDIVKAGFQPC